MCNVKSSRVHNRSWVVNNQKSRRETEVDVILVGVDMI